MTRYHAEDELATVRLVSHLDADVSWLRHRGLAAELDRRMLQGATEDELVSVRQGWMAHVAHLRKVHRVRVEEESPGFWRITGATAPAAEPEAGKDPIAANDTIEDEGEEIGVEIQAHARPSGALDSMRLVVTARALAALASEGLLSNAMLKASVGMLIRQASESHHWHNCAHYRSLDAKNRIAAAGIATAAGYQAFCRSNLRHEHVVPNSVIYKLLCQSQDLSVDGIAALLSTFSIRATITREEDRRLTELGLSSSMPAPFFEAGHALHLDPMARYRAANLFDQLERRTGNLWFGS